MVYPTGAGQVTPPSADNPNMERCGPADRRLRCRPRVGDGRRTGVGVDHGWRSTQAATGLWSGNSPTYSFKLLGTELAPLNQFYIASTYIVTWGADVPGWASSSTR